MNRTIVGLLIAASVVSVAPVAQAKGCLKGAAVGGVGGHVAGHHGLAGAAVGCAVGRHMANKKGQGDRSCSERTRAGDDCAEPPSRGTGPYTGTRPVAAIAHGAPGAAKQSSARAGRAQALTLA